MLTTMAEDSAVKVCVRVRPLITREESSASENAEPVQLYWKANKKSIHQIDDGNSTKSFSFDRVFTADETTDQLYRDIAKPLVVSTVEGYNGTIFAYGQTSSGKTFTMMGDDHILGVMPLAVEDVFQTIKTCPKKEFLLRVSYMEIYNETVTDLLVDSRKRKPLEVRETINKNICVADLTEELVTSPAQALAWIRKGEKNRHYGKTKMNQRSSRSHTIFRMILESRERSDSETADGAIIVSHLNLVDLAGSERASQTGAEGARFKEGCNINRSLFTLGQVIKKLTDENQKGFTNYRDSKLTRILQNSLGGNAKTVIICTITAAALDETLSTLQFASTAKKMKNDPHVTEVSDDGALLKRYRNEIVDLKRRLHEVSSVTQTTATEKEVLSQLLQEKDQLQREQEDRIKNLTQLLVTGSNLVPFRRMPKRRVTWGGKMLRLAPESTRSGGSSDLSFAELSTQKRKADRSCLLELAEEDGDFDTHWEIPEEPSDDMDVSQASVTVRSFGDSPKDFISPNQIHELSGKVSSLELQVEVESRQKEEAMAEVESLNGRVCELELQLQEEAQHNRDAMEKTQAAEQRAAELDLQLRTEAQHKQDAMEKVEMLEFRVADLERQVEEWGHTQNTDSDQMTREFAESVRLCETLSSEKDVIVAERDYLKQEVGMFMEQLQRLEREKAVVSQELEEQRETEEFKKLEEQFRKDHEAELQDELSNLKNASESSEIQCLELQNKLEAMSEELKKKTELAEELQNMCGRDLVKEVAMLRRSLDDAEGVGRDTKKEWAFLRSQNIALEERDVTLTANHEKMEAEVNSLRSQLETEKAYFKKMQNDLQKELNVAFAENTKLNTLLDGKVPKSLIDSVELERTVTQLNKELAARREAEGVLKAQLEELDSLRDLPVQVDNLTKQVSELSAELFAVQSEKDSLLTAQTLKQCEVEELAHSLQTSQEEILKITQDLSAAALRENELSQRFDEATQKLETLRSDMESLNVEKHHLIASTEETVLKLEESERHRASLSEKLTDVQQAMKDLEAKLTDTEESRSAEEEISKELQQQVNRLTEELQCVRAEYASAHSLAEEVEKLHSVVTSVTAERDQLKATLQEKNVEIEGLQHQEELQQNSDQVNILKQRESDLEQQVVKLSQELQRLRAEKDGALASSAHSSAEEVDKLLSTVAALTAERDQLKMDMQENVDMMIENQEELRAALEKNRKQKELIEELEAAQSCKQDSPDKDMNVQLEELQTQMKSMSEELQSVRADRDRLLKERTDDSQRSTEEMEKLLCTVTALTEERDQLQDILEELRQDKQQLRAQLEDQVDTLQAEITQLNASVHTVTEQKKQLEEDLHHNLHMVSTTQELLKSVEEELCEQKQINSDLKALRHNEETLDQQIQTLTEKLQSTEAERDHLLSEKQADSQRSTEEMEKLLCTVTALTEERDQLQDILEELRQDKQQLRAQLEDQVDTLQAEASETQILLHTVQEELHKQNQKNSDLMKSMSEELQSVKADRDRLLKERTDDSQRSTEEMEKLLCTVTALTEERDQLQDILEELRQDKQQLRAQLEDQVDTLQAEVQDLKKQLHTFHEKRTHAEAEAEASQQLLSEANRTISELREQLRSPDQDAYSDKGLLSTLLQNSTLELQTSLRKFQDFTDICSTVTSMALDKVKAPCSLSPLPKSTMKVYSAVCQLRLQSLDTLGSIAEHLQAHTQGYKNLFDALINKDLAVFEERRLQDVLLCKTQAPSYSIKDEDFHSLWKPRVTELLDKRQLYLQKMGFTLEKLQTNMASLRNELTTEIREREWFKEQLEPARYSNLEGILNSELERRSALIQTRTRTLQDITEEHNVLQQELKLLEVQSDSRLRKERSKRSTLLQALEVAPLQTELDLLKNNQQLLLQLQQAEDHVKSVRVENEELKEAQVKASQRISNHKQATQLLQTELQDSRAQVQDKETVIQTLKNRLQELEKNASPSAVELEKLKTKVLKMEVEQSLSSDKHQQEILKLTTSLNEKEESLRRLKLNLRTSQQQGDESFLQGKDLHARLTKPKGVVVQSSIALEKTKLEEEVTKLQLRVTELQSLVSSQQTEISKWKSRAMRMKGQTETTKAQSPCAPSRRRPPLVPDSEPLSSPKRLRCNPNQILESPRKGVESPKVSLLNSPKSRFFDTDGSSELLSRNCPKQFFDNSALGTIPGASVEADQKEAWSHWPTSPKPDTCKTQ